MGQFCGTTTPEPLSSSGNVITIRFKSDASTTFYGFGIVYFERNGTGKVMRKECLLNNLILILFQRLKSKFLGHLSHRFIYELKVYTGIRRPSVRRP